MNTLDLDVETLRSLTDSYHQNQLEKMCAELEVEMAAYSQEIMNYLQLLKAIRDGRNKAQSPSGVVKTKYRAINNRAIK